MSSKPTQGVADERQHEIIMENDTESNATPPWADAAPGQNGPQPAPRQGAPPPASMFGDEPWFARHQRFQRRYESAASGVQLETDRMERFRRVTASVKTRCVQAARRVFQYITARGGRCVQGLAPGMPAWFTPGFRLRPRGRATRFVESCLGREDLASLVGGTSSPNYPVARWFELVRGRGGKVVGHHLVMADGDDPKVIDVAVQIVNDSGNNEILSMGLLSRLAVYCAFRPRTPELLLALRARAAQYGKELGLEQHYLALVIPATVAQAHVLGHNERVAWKSLGGPGGKETDEWTSELVAGVVRGKSVFWPVPVLLTALCLAVQNWESLLGHHAGWTWKGLEPASGLRSFGPAFGRLTLATRGVHIHTVTGVVALSFPWTVALLWTLPTLAWLFLLWLQVPRNARERVHILGRGNRGIAKGGT